MNELIIQLMFCLRAIQRYRWPMFGIMAAVSLIACSGVLFKPDKFEARATLRLSSESMLDPIMDGLITKDNMTQELANLMKRSLVARPNLEQVIRETDLNLEVRTKVDQQKLLEMLAKKVVVKADRQGKLFNITYTGGDPKQVKEVVDVLMKIFIEKSVGATDEGSAMSRRFLDLRIKDYEGKLEAAETRLKVFKRDNFSSIPAEGQSVFARMNTATQELVDAKLQLREAQKRREALQLRLEKTGAPVSAADQAKMIAEADEIKTLESDLTDLTTRFTDRHPHVVVMRDKLEALRGRRSQSNDETQHDAGYSLADGGQAYRDMVVELGNAEADVAAFSERVDSYVRLISSLKIGIDKMTAVEADFAKVNRDYEIIKNLYSALVNRRESAELTDQVKNSTSNIRFEIVEPPVLPVLPAGPSRLILLIVSMVLAIGAGGAGAVALGVLNAPVSSEKDLAEIAPYPVLGIVSSTLSIKPLKTNRDLAAYAAACSLLLVFYGGLIFAQVQQFDLAQYVVGMFS